MEWLSANWEWVLLGFMVLEKLGDALRETLRKIAGASHISPELIKELVRDIQRALLQSDVNVRLALNLSKRIVRDI